MNEQNLKELINKLKELGTLELYVLAQECVKEIERRLENEKTK